MLAPLLFAVYFVHLCLPHYVLLYIMYIHRIQIGVGTPARGNAFLNSALRGRNPNIFISGADEACNKNEFLFSNIMLYNKRAHSSKFNLYKTRVTMYSMDVQNIQQNIVGQA